MFADGFAISDLWLTDIGLDLILAHHAIDDDLEVQLAHAADDGLSAVGIGMNLKFKVHTDPDSGQTIISGMGELHLEIIIDRMMREYKVEANVGKPQVAYRETIRKHSEAEGKYIRQTGGRGQYGHAKIKLDPQPPGTGYEFVNDIIGGSVPKEFIKPIDQGIQEALEGGVLAGYPVVDVKATLYDGSYHDVDSNEMAFKIA